MKSILSKAKNGLAVLRSGLSFSTLRSKLREIWARLLAALPWTGQPPRRVKTPTVLQMEAVECGAAALGTVLEYHGRVVPLEELREACGVSRDGSKASNMMKAARSYGLTAKGYKKQPSSLKEMKGPMIVHWNFNHFVVLEGVRNGKVYINDPATGPRVVTEEEFDDAFTGVVLTFEPGPDFEEGGSRRSLLKALGDRLKGSEQAVLYVVLAGLALVVPGLVVPTFSKIFVDNILVGEAHNWIRPLLLAMGIASVVLIGLTWLQENYLMRLETKLASSTSGKFFWHVLRLPFRFFTQRYGGEIGTRVGLNDKVARMLSGKLATTMLSVIMIVFYAALMIQYDLVLTIIGVVIAGLNIVVMRYISRKRKDANRRLLQERGKMKGTAMGGLQTIETLKATGSETDFFTRWAGHHAKTINAQQQLGRYSQALTIAPSFLMQIGTASILGVGAFRVMDGQMSMGMLVAFQALMGSFISPVNDLVSMAGKYQEAEGDMDRLDDVLRYEADRDPELDSEVEELSLRTAVGRESDPAKESEGASLSAKLEGRLELRDVTFGYNNLEDPFIDGLNLELTPGSRVALVGGSGSGKSTVGKLVCGLCEPWSGEIRFDGVSREEVPPSILNNSFSFVDQDIFLFRGSVMENLTLWDETVPEADVIEAARDATIHEAISQRPHGYHSEVKESGRNFSGGQQQRLEIARALSGRPSVMVLDEATSALDVATEKAIDDNIRRRGCTCLIIAHRLSTIRDCDEIIVLDDGTVVERGTHDNLIEQNGPYASLIEKY